MLKNKHSLIRTLGMVCLLFLCLAVFTANSGINAFAEDIMSAVNDASGTLDDGGDGGDEPPVDPPDPPEPELISIEGARVILSHESFVYTGSEIIPEVTVILEDQILVQETDYTVAFENNIGPGRATVKVTGTGNYTGEAFAYFSIINSGWIQMDGYWYYIGSDGGFSFSCWVRDSVGWCWLGSDGRMVTNRWISYKGDWYYLGSGGHMAYNRWQKDSVGWCWLNSDGRMARDRWLRINSDWYYIKPDGHMAANRWQKDSAGWCWLGADGRMVKTKWVNSGKNWYYIGSDGHMVSNKWVKDSKGWCYLGDDGKMLTKSWIRGGSNWFWVKADGHMAASEWIKDPSNGEYYYLNENGARSYSRWQFIKKNDCWYYFYADGTHKTEPYVFVSIEDQTLYYCEKGELVFNTPVVTGKLYPKDHHTPTGTFYLRGKGRDVHLKGLEDDGVTEYDSFVRYWMPFIGGEFGLHDADWRSSFGGTIYKYNGSHGCVNMPPDAARRLYERITVGTMIRIQ